MITDPAIKAIPTVFNGQVYRSRIEARWACFMDTLTIPFSYEPEAYNLNGICYLPDFYLPVQNCYLEIKLLEPTPEEQEKAGRLATASRKPVYLFHGPIIEPNWPHGDLRTWAYQFTVQGWDDCYMWCECSTCGALGIQFDGRSDRLPCKKGDCPRSEHGDKGYNFDSPRLMAAYRKARTYRFW